MIKDINIKNNGNNIFYIVDNKHSVMYKNILFNCITKPHFMTFHYYKIKNRDISLFLSDDSKYYVLIIENTFYIFDIKRIIKSSTNILSIHDIFEDELLIKNLKYNLSNVIPGEEISLINKIRNFINY